MIKDLVEYTIKKIVEEPEKVSVIETQEGKRIVLEVRVASVDVGKVIGKEGRTIKALRNMVSALSEKDSEFLLDVVEAK
ncbi:MAG: hypothetical protein UR26_C0002G0092 [candidate division TM6 bacterium GW2011_GWF2_32_72]|nr:MAG: hypothetical protein UR26_C0002G0092 [candidate division TM6 bacterium GW2011_GWF2_32_72]